MQACHMRLQNIVHRCKAAGVPQEKQPLTVSCASMAQGRSSGNASAENGGEAALSIEEAKSRLHAELSAEDPFNGEMVIRNIVKPFILEDEGSVLESWKI